ncbi:hypothetical protein CFC21_022357 [Triticum aestivum]|uniref:RING-type domain-containing protein n=2 Tax=Triticum aestivum TaxID=4565 RepID=A0A3B6C251_WHEAT|nr:RING-H2 finger protein ATL78-like [Triticum aestivum]KAF7007412.1 hypothetical protein CFC21_022357 [Triticum aestivum]
MDSANGDNMAAGIMRLLMLMARGPSAADAMPVAGGGRVEVRHFIFSGDGGDLFSGEVGGSVPPASKAAIASLKEVQAAGEGEGEGSLGDCAICLDAFGAGKEMPCGHRFHGECLERWLGVHGSCPVCRHELPKAEPAAEEQPNGDGERRGPRGAVLVSIVTLRGAERPQQEEEQREEPVNIRIEDVD